MSPENFKKSLELIYQKYPYSKTVDVWCSPWENVKIEESLPGELRLHPTKLDEPPQFQMSVGRVTIHYDTTVPEGNCFFVISTEAGKLYTLEIGPESEL